MAVAFNIGEAIRYFEELGVYEYFLPFLLVFSIVFAILEKTQIFGSMKYKTGEAGHEVEHEVAKTSINAIVSVVMGLLLIGRPEIVAVINAFIPNVAMIIVIILMFLLLAMMVSPKTRDKDGKETGAEPFLDAMKWIAGIVGTIALLIALAPTFNWQLSSYEIERLLSIGIFVLLILGVIALVVWGSKAK